MTEITLYKENTVNDEEEVFDKRVYTGVPYPIKLVSKYFEDGRKYQIEIYKGDDIILEIQDLQPSQNVIEFDLKSKDIERKFQTGTSKKFFRIVAIDSFKKKLVSKPFKRRKTARNNTSSSSIKPITKSDSDGSLNDEINDFNVFIREKTNNKKYNPRLIRDDSQSYFGSKIYNEDEVSNHNEPKISKFESMKINDGKNESGIDSKVKSDDANITTYSFILLISDKAKCDGYEIRDSIYLIDDATFTKSTMLPNHAFRTMEKNKNKIEYMASFKIIDERGKKLRSGQKIDVTKQFTDLLKNGIPVKINNKTIEFVYFGHSNSGMREGNFWAIDKLSYEKNKFEQDLVRTLGDFSEITTKGKLCKRFGQAFSKSIETIELKKCEYTCLSDDQCTDDDGETYDITDGVGVMRLRLAKEISENIKQLRVINYVPYVFQVRFGGFKGCLSAIDDDHFDRILKNSKRKFENIDDIQIIFRKSQKKFELDLDNIVLNVVSWPNYILPPATLNLEFLMILDGLAEFNKNKEIKEYIIKLYKDYLEDASDSLKDPKKALEKLFSNGETSEYTIKFSSILLACNGDMNKNLEKEIYSMIKHKIIDNVFSTTLTKKKFFIPLEKSRYFIGVIDETNTLNEDEIYFAFRTTSGNVEYLNDVDVAIAKTPCYALSEMRKVRAKYVPELKHLVNCVVFSKKCKRPLPNILGGGDLDGDLYFVTWDENLTKFKNMDPIKYPKSHPNISKDISKSSINDILECFVENVLASQNIGLWHYKLLCLYNQSRENMLTNEYKNAVFNINKCIDGHSTQGPGYINLKPNWYVTENEIKEAFTKTENSKDYSLNNLSEKITNLRKVFEAKNFKSENGSLLRDLMLITIEKFIKLTEEDNERGRFFSDEDIKTLQDDMKIDLSLVKGELNDDNCKMLNALRETYLEFLSNDRKNKQFKKRILNKDTSMYVGMAEKIMNTENSRVNNEISLKKKQFRQNVIDYPYKIERSINVNEIKKYIHTDSGIYIQSRVIQLYLHLRDTKDYYLAWEFYDILCHLKNYVNYKKGVYNNSLLLNMPCTIPVECLGAFSMNKLKNVLGGSFYDD